MSITYKQQRCCNQKYGTGKLNATTRVFWTPVMRSCHGSLGVRVRLKVNGLDSLSTIPRDHVEKTK